MGKAPYRWEPAPVKRLVPLETFCEPEATPSKAGRETAAKPVWLPQRRTYRPPSFDDDSKDVPATPRAAMAAQSTNFLS